MNKIGSPWTNASDEQTQFKQDIVSWGVLALVSLRHHIVWRQDKDGKIKRRSYPHQALEGTARRAEDSLMPNRDISVVLQQRLELVCNGQPFDGRSDK